MALYADSTKVKRTTKPELSHWKAVHGPGSEVEYSGIYECQVCKREIAANKGDKFPPQNKSQHGPDCRNVQWKLVVRTNPVT